MHASTDPLPKQSSRYASRVQVAVRYLAELSPARLVLWCYLVWYLGVAIPYFDPSPRLWISSLGISVVIGTALYLSIAHAGTSPTRLDFWQIARLFIMPLCVSSFSALIKDRGFVLIFHPTLRANLMMLALCGALVASSRLARHLMQRPSLNTPPA